MRSPYHLRTVEVRNVTGEPLMLKIEPTASQHLGAATTFTGLLRPGEVKSLYLYHGFEYAFRILDENGGAERTRTVLEVGRDFGLDFAGDSLIADARAVVRVGPPAATFADSLQQLDPFGLRRSRPIEPDTTRGGRMEGDPDPSRRRPNLPQ